MIYACKEILVEFNHFLASIMRLNKTAKCKISSSYFYGLYEGFCLRISTYFLLRESIDFSCKKIFDVTIKVFLYCNMKEK